MYDKNFRMPVFREDTYTPFWWQPQQTTVLNVYTLNSAGSCEVFGNSDVGTSAATSADIQLDHLVNISKPLHGFRTRSLGKRPVISWNSL
jgi:hypothetical protein